ncbi:MAG: hypothetical protein JWN20_2127 [Jatrophihabitantaceae bacterium]|nr:hypothetical protein [Jatrophihabitantaceae bacterium]
MGFFPKSFQDRSAAHYVLEPVAAARLRTTLALAARTVDFPIAMINILGADTQHTISAVGVDRTRPLPRKETFCDIVVTTGEPLIVHDTEEPQFLGIPASSRAAVGTYAGVPLMGRESVTVGSLCVIDSRDREVTPEQMSSLIAFSRIIDDQLDLIRRLNEHHEHVDGSAEELAQALAAGRIMPWYQPVVDLRTGVTVGYEALARWIDSSDRVRLPSEFIPLGEDSDLIVELDQAVVRRAIEDLGRWQVEFPAGRVAINISGRNFDRDGWVTGMLDIAVDAGVAPESVALELTETARLTTSHEADAVIEELRHHGFGLLLDDFGTGWSSLEYLLRLLVSGIKIDRVVSATLGSRVGNALVRAVNGVAAELGIATTIEGIETVAQAREARDLQCDFGQGFYWSHPASAAAIDRAPINSILRLGGFVPTIA